MWTTKDQSSRNAGPMCVALDWESLGRYVRKRTLEAVAMHFAAMGVWDGTLSRRFQAALSSAQAEACGSQDRERLSE